MKKLPYLAPKKSFSQNFLTDVIIAKRIVESLEILPDETIIEIGPGTGSLTRFILETQAKSIHVLELDERAVSSLRSSYPATTYPALSIHHTDALANSIESYTTDNKRCSVIGNLPYSITSDLLFHIYDSAGSVRRAILMVQKEVAKRITAQPRTKDYGVLTLATELVGKAKILFDVQPGSFYPRPSVTSAVFAIDFHTVQRPSDERKELTKLIRSAFGQRRKMLRNSLDSYTNSEFGIDIASVNHPFLTRRAEELSLTDVEELYRSFAALSATK
jgi:16S rRNA (adenine1518-N6/adenine1519-N6)-dimethyltransferase